MFTRNSATRNYIYPILFLIFSFSVSAQQLPDKIKNYVKSLHDNHHFDGTILVAEGDKVVYKGAFGTADKTWGIPHKVDTKFLLASVSKQFTSMLILKLVEAGKVDLQEKLSTYLPDYPKEKGDKMTIHQLLSHSAGMPHYAGFRDIDVNFFEEYGRTTRSVDEYVELIGKMEFLTEPGTEYSYSSMGYILLGAMVEKVSGMSYNQAIQTYICQPLGMQNTGFAYDQEIIPNLAGGYVYTISQLDDGQTYIGYRNEPYRDQSNKYSTGGVHSTVEDLFKWTRGIWSNKLIAPEYRKMMFTRQADDYGYGWSMDDVEIDGKQHTVIEHGGGLTGFRTHVCMFDEGRITVISLCNVQTANGGRLARNILRIMNDQETAPMLDGALLTAAKMATASIKEGREYHILLKSQPAQYWFSAGSYNNAGYRLINAGQLQAAVALFQLATQAYPKDANLHDSLGEAYLTSGDKTKATELYEKALKIANEDPDNNRSVIQNANRMLERIRAEQ